MQRIKKIGFFVFLLLLTQIFLPLSFITQLSHSSQHGILAWILSLYITASYVAFIYFAGAWSWFGTIVRSALPVLLAIIAVATYPQYHGEITISALLAVEPMISICIGTTFSVIMVLVLLGRRLAIPAREMSFPLRSGTYVVAQGGSSHLVNIHVTNPSQRYALDILKLNEFGIRARGLYPADLRRYAIFGTEIVSPCDGVIAAVEDGFADFSPPERDLEHRAGNYIAIECDEATIYLAHLMKGSICIKVGEHIRTGQVMGRVGNSGNTTEPHLHIHAEEGSYPGHFSGNRGVPLRFNKRFLIRNDRVIVPN